MLWIVLSKAREQDHHRTIDTKPSLK
uniref:Uncharacterized protein n=1 Tax=Rhizophora mucronata TaxID=61149 RepID=A0A2P2QLR2_RHIMU